MKTIDYIDFVELKTDNTTKSRFYFGEQPTLRDRRVIHLLHHNSGAFITPLGRQPLGTVVNDCYLVLASKGREAIYRYPLKYFDSASAPLGQILPIEINREIDWPKSYVECVDPTQLASDESFYFTFLCSERQKGTFAGVGLNIEAIEIKTTPATVTKFAFPDHENLSGKRIAKIETIQDVNITLSPSKYTMVNTTVFDKTVLTMISKGNEVIRKIPAKILNCGYPFEKNIPLDFIPDLPNCILEIPNTTGLVADEVYVFLMYYFDHYVKVK